MDKTSKPIQKVDDASKQFIIEALEGDVTHGFDIDSICFCKGRWYIFEYLKCDNEYMTPYTSDPKYYPYNWKKFYSLYVITKQLNGILFLVNYSTREKDRDEVKVMEVMGFDYEKAKNYSSKTHKGAYEYMQLRSVKYTRASFSSRLRKLNMESSIPILFGEKESKDEI